MSKDEQRKRFLKRIEEPSKNWKFSMGDVRERAHWDDYMTAYEETIRHTATPYAPWYVVPADHKWFTRLVVAAAVIDALDEMNLEYPKVDAAKKRELAEARRLLHAEKKENENSGEGSRHEKDSFRCLCTSSRYWVLPEPAMRNRPALRAK